jgi:hypothetical protein
VRLEASTKPHVHRKYEIFWTNIESTMACPNFKNGPKNDLSPLGVKAINATMTRKLSQSSYVKVIMTRSPIFRLNPIFQHIEHNDRIPEYETRIYVFIAKDFNLYFEFVLNLVCCLLSQNRFYKKSMWSADNYEHLSLGILEHFSFNISLNFV